MNRMRRRKQFADRLVCLVVFGGNSVAIWTILETFRLAVEQ